MKFAIAFVAVLAVLAVQTPSAQAFNPVQELRCFKSLLDALQYTATAEVEWLNNARARLARLEQAREACEAIRLPKFREACLATQDTLHKAEKARLLLEIQGKAQNSPALVAQLLRDFENCSA